MSERRAPRLILEVAFLAALSAALTFTDLATYAIAGVMAVGWLLVVVFEWGALRARAHYGSGLPPRWYVPRTMALPPPRPLEQLSSGYPAPDATADAPTWIASPAMLAEWPVADIEPVEESPVEEQTHVHDVLEAELAIAVAEDEPVPTAPVAPEEEVEGEDELEADAEPEPEPHEEPAPVAPQPVVGAATGGRFARHRIDPLATPPAKGRRFGRRGEQVTYDAEVPEGPPRVRALPSQARDEE